MATFQPIRNTKAVIDNTPIVDGQFLMTTDLGIWNKIYLDNGTQRINLNGDKTATSVTITDTNNYFTSGNVEGALSETGMKINELEGYIGYTSSDIYGVEVDVVNKTFTRLAGAVGKIEGADFNSINAFGGRKRCNLTDSGVVTAYYGETAYTETGALTQQVIKNGITYPIGTKVQVMVEQPKFYYKVVPLKLDKIEGKGFHNRKARYYVSDTMKAGFKLHPAFIVNGESKNFVYLSAYEGSLYDVSASAYILDDAQVADFTVATGDKLSSIANAKPMSGFTQNLIRSNTRKLAQNRGTGWQQAYTATVAASHLLMLIEYASFNMQSKIGNGAVSKVDDDTTNMSEPTGATTLLGNTSGIAVNTNGIQFVSYRGEENFWGNIWGWVDGINIYTNNEQSVYVADNGFTDDVSTSPYSDVGFTGAKMNGYVSAFGYSEGFDWLFYPSETFGDSNLPVGDHHWLNSQSNGWTVGILGGIWGYGSVAGAFSWNVYHTSSTRYRYVGGRLVYVPSAVA